MPVFPHLKDTQFPDVANVDVYKYQNNFNYARYDTTQMHIQICSVPWDMGEAHIGNRTISGIGNVVWFETEAKRDKWFDDIPDTECIRFDTKYKELHRDNQIMVPVPFDVACLFNYLVVSYEPFASRGDLIQYETDNGLDKWFWFIREVEFVAPNATKLHLMNDAFQTFMYRIHINGMILERGHAPMFATDADTYLSNPLENNSGLLAEDVNYGAEPSKVASSAAHVFNDETLAVIACTSSPTSTWGTKAADTWNTPALASYTVDGVPNIRMFAMQVSDLNTFLGNVENDFPQFKQTVKGVFFAPSELLDLGTSFDFAGVSCNLVSTTKHSFDFMTLSKSKFGYASEYADLAKLYTYPYAHIEVTDENGNTDVIRIEDTDGSLKISACLSLAYPAINIQAHILGYGSSAENSISFANITDRSLTIGGKWYETLHTWDVPMFGIVQSSAKHYDYDTHFDRAQAVTAYTNEYASSTASAATALTNAKASAATDKTNADNSADTITDNAQLQATANTTSTAAGAAESVTSTLQNAILNNTLTGNANAYTYTSANNQIALTEATAAASQAANGVGTALSAGMSLASGNMAGAAMAVANGITSAATLAVQTEAGVNYTSAQAAASAANNSDNAAATNTAQANLNSASVISANTRRDAANALTTGSAANSAATMKTNASNSKTTANNNADRTYNTDTANAGRTQNTAQSAVSNGIKQAALGRPFEFGDFRDNGQATTKPLALFANIVTQAKSAIEQAGDEFLRYGYYYNRQWHFDGNWNIGKYFTYWKLADFWVKGLSIPDMYVDKLRFFLYGGVTVWRAPEDIGNVTIYENGRG